MGGGEAGVETGNSEEGRGVPGRVTPSQTSKDKTNNPQSISQANTNKPPPQLQQTDKYKSNKASSREEACPLSPLHK